MRLTSPLNLPAPGRRQCVYGALRGLARTCVFAKQSLGPILCGPPQLPCTGHQKGHPFFRSYGIIMPSSLTRFHSFTLGYSPCPPVSVYGTDVCSIPHQGFSCLSTPHHLDLGCPASSSQVSVSLHPFTAIHKAADISFQGPPGVANTLQTGSEY